MKQYKRIYEGFLVKGKKKGKVLPSLTTLPSLPMIVITELNIFIHMAVLIQLLVVRFCVYFHYPGFFFFVPYLVVAHYVQRKGRWQLQTESLELYYPV